MTMHKVSLKSIPWLIRCFANSKNRSDFVSYGQHFILYTSIFILQYPSIVNFILHYPEPISYTSISSECSDYLLGMNISQRHIKLLLNICKIHQVICIFVFAKIDCKIQIVAAILNQVGSKSRPAAKIHTTL